MKKSTTIAIVLIAAILLGLYMCAYTVKEHEQVVILAFGKVTGDPIDQPGLHFKIPWYEARRFDKRWLGWDGDPNQITTLDKRYILIDAFARWRIVDPVTFVEKVRDEQSAQGRLDDILDGAIRNVIANHNLIELIRSTNREFQISEEEMENLLQTFEDLKDTPTPTIDIPEDLKEELEEDLTEEKQDDETQAVDNEKEPTDPSNNIQASSEKEKEEMQKNNDQPKQEHRNDSRQRANEAMYQIEIGRPRLVEMIIERAEDKAEELGIELRDVRLKRIDYIESVQASVFQRMISERKKVASRLRAQGDGLSAKILGRKERDLRQIRSQAYKTAEEIKGRADAQAARIYADAYNKDPDLYRFLKTLETYSKAMGEDTWLIITTNSELGTYFKSSK